MSTASWLPTIWLGILASRPVSAWLGTGGGVDTLDGSPVDRNFYLLCIGAGLVILSRRNLNWSVTIGRAWPLFLFYGFLLISTLWANSPLVSAKRWIKESGNIVIALLILSETNPLEAFRATFTRCGLLLVPLSYIFIRYFPDLGRRYNQHTGQLEAVGVTYQKNSLGTMIMACGLIMLWDWLESSRPDAPKRSLAERIAFPAVGALGAYLLHLCDSKTSIVSLATAIVIVVAVRVPLLRYRISAFGTYTLFAVVLFFLVDRYVGISESIIRALGRDMTFTGRTDVWRELFAVGTDPLLGTGFMSFWDDDFFRSRLPYWVAHSAHNGYIEVYLAGGFIGVFFLVVMLLGTIRSINAALAAQTAFSVVQFSILVMALMANFAESNFACMTPIGLLFVIAAIGSVASRQYPTTGALYTPDEAPVHRST
ncbi:O-antigen ligase family protein [Horticoccus sp. 23ND18S-11]|uniref:O-antigen ligase family protein n=1 Tax=Horticoccus sp. 23ND18S-11 TaxID=3391832 RepID=UPI0039C9A7C2